MDQINVFLTLNFYFEPVWTRGTQQGTPSSGAQSILGGLKSHLSSRVLRGKLCAPSLLWNLQGLHWSMQGFGWGRFVWQAMDRPPPQYSAVYCKMHPHLQNPGGILVGMKLAYESSKHRAGGSFWIQLQLDLNWQGCIFTLVTKGNCAVFLTCI